MNVRYASTQAGAVTGLHFVEGDSGDTLQASGADPVLVSDQVGSAGSGLGEVAAATADCSVPTAALQHLIDFVHTQGGLPWWLSIAATTVAIRVMVLPVLIFQMKATARLTLMRPELEAITKTIKESGYDPKVTEANQKRMKELFTKHKTNPFMPLMGAFVQAPLFISFFFAIRNMAEKVPSFKEGGALWFTDLTTADPYFILPIMSGAFTLATIELGAMDGMQGQPMIGKMKMFFRGFAVLIVPLTATFPKALFCYWLTTNMCSLIQTTVLRQPSVKRAVGIPETAHLAAPVTPAALATAVTLPTPPKRVKKNKR
jgi:YidC/Oxa1 family membrane protein insertase